jgi:hypothetical protein
MKDSIDSMCGNAMRGTHSLRPRKKWRAENGAGNVNNMPSNSVSHVLRQMNRVVRRGTLYESYDVSGESYVSEGLLSHP